MKLTESDAESAALSYLRGLGYQVQFGPDLAPGERKAEREDYGQVVLPDRLRYFLPRINPTLPPEVREEAVRKVIRPEFPDLLLNNHAFHRLLVDGVPVDRPLGHGQIRGERVMLVDFDDPSNNDWLAVNQFTVVEGQHERRADIVIFLNGLPLAVFELKNPAREQADLRSAFNQLQTYKRQIPVLFTCNELLVISDGLEARLGALTSPWERFSFWRSSEDRRTDRDTEPQLRVLIESLFEPATLLDYLRYFVVFEQDAGRLEKKIAGYHQFHAARRAVETTLRASRPEGDRRAGVIWHTQGSGKSLTMAFYAGKLIAQPDMANPTLVLLTDRNDLDDQLFGTFSRCHELLRQKPVQADNAAHLRSLLRTAGGGVIFTTIQKFLPEEPGKRLRALSARHNIVVIADEAHRSQYDFLDGFARRMREALPEASFIGFTGTPIELDDRNTRAVFGDYVDIYDIERAVEDQFTVPIYYESRLAQLDLEESEKPHIDPDFEAATETEEVERKEKLKSKWAQLEAVVGTERRLKLIAEDLLRHFDARLETMDGKAMIVCMSRRIAVALYDEIIKLRPQWHSDDDRQGVVKVVMTGAPSDPVEWQGHIRNKPRREALAERFKDPAEGFRIAIVRDMWLTGFDVPCLHTMYIDKPMRGHTLMQAIARVNRVYRDKPGGLVTDYIGLADCLRQAMADYTQSGGQGETTIDQEQAVQALLERYEVCSHLFHGFDYSGFATAAPADRLAIMIPAQEHILAQPNGKDRLFQTVAELSKAFALAVPHPTALAIRDDVAFFQAVRAALAKSEARDRRPQEDLDHAIRQIVSRAIAADEVLDIFQVAGLPKPNISILSEEFLAEVREMPQRNLAVEVLRKLLNDEVRTRSRTNLVQSHSFAKMLEDTVRRYRNRTIETAQIIEELIALARQMREAAARGEQLDLSEDELAFYDALDTNDSAVQVLGDAVLRQIARELADIIRKNTTIDWTVRENVRANLRRLVKRQLRKHGYPPDKQEKATQTVLEQAELMAATQAQDSLL